MPKQQGQVGSSAAKQGSGTSQSPRQELSKLIRREMRRAERTRTPLSLVMLHPPTSDGGNAFDVARLSEIVLRSSRETDLSFQIDPSLLVVVLLDTDLAGADAFLRKIQQQARDLPVSGATEEYPGPRFDLLLGGAAGPVAGTPASASVKQAATHRSIATPAPGKQKSR